MGIRDWSSDVCSSDLAATESLGRALARLLRLGDVIALSGDLGAGKTALARALIRALPGPQGAADEEVPSPTFTLAQIYERRPGPVWHFDLYRLESAAEVECGMLKLRCHVIDTLEMIGGQCAALYPEKPIYDIPGYPRIVAQELVDRLVEKAAP